MALNPGSFYGIQLLSGQPGYPYGKARNVNIPGDGSGTPWEASLVNDWLGFQQALLVAAGITPSGTPDSSIASQYTDAIKYLIAHVTGDTQVSGSVHAAGFIAAAGDSIGGGHNFLGLTDFAASVLFNDGWTSQRQVTVNLSGIVTGAGFTAIGNGLAGIIVQAGGIQVLAGYSTFQAPVEFDDELVLAGAGRIRKRVVYGVDDSVTTYSFSTADRIVARSGIVTASRIYTIDEVGAGLGAEVEFLNFTAFVMTVHNIGGGTIATVPAISGGLPGKLRISHVDDGVSERWVAIA